MANISQMLDTLTEYTTLLKKLPPSEEHPRYPSDLETKVRHMVMFQRGLGLSSRLDEVFERLLASYDKEVPESDLERVNYLLSQLCDVLDDITTDAAMILAFFLPPDFGSQVEYIRNLESARPGQKISILKEGKGLFEVLSKINEAMSLAFQRALIGISAYPEKDLSDAVWKKINSTI